MTLATKNDGRQCSDRRNYDRLRKCETMDAQLVAPGAELAPQLVTERRMIEDRLSDASCWIAEALTKAATASDVRQW